MSYLKIILRAFLGVAACLLMAALPGHAAEPQVHGTLIPMSAVTPNFTHPGGGSWRILDLNDHVDTKPNIGYGPVDTIRLHFGRVVDRSAVDYRVVLSGMDGRTVTWTRDEFAARGEFWSPAIVGRKVTVDVIAASPPAGLSFVIDKRIEPFNWGKVEPPGKDTIMRFAERNRIDGTAPDFPALFAAERLLSVQSNLLNVVQSIIGKNDMEELRFPQSNPETAAGAGAVVMLRIVQGDVPVTCTGVLIGPDKVLTNEHCIRSQADCDTTTAWFGHQRQPNKELAPGDEQIDCRKVDRQPDPILDFAVIRLARAPSPRWPVIPLGAAAPCLGEAVSAACIRRQELVVIHHPGGSPKMMTRTDCTFSTAVAKVAGAFTHTCDTDRGSSGAPVFAVGSGGRIIGLHHAGHERQQCTGPYCANEAMRAELIQAALEKPEPEPLPPCPRRVGDPHRSSACPGG